MVMTKRGIYHNLNESEYAISNNEVALFFSSKFYLGKFLGEYKQHRKDFKKRIARSMEVRGMNTDLLADIHFYKEIEKRGFRAFLLVNVAKNVVGIDKIEWKKGELSWQELHQFGLVNMTEKSTLNWYEMQNPK